MNHIALIHVMIPIFVVIFFLSLTFTSSLFDTDYHILSDQVSCNGSPMNDGLCDNGYEWRNGMLYRV